MTGNTFDQLDMSLITPAAAAKTKFYIFDCWCAFFRGAVLTDDTGFLLALDLLSPIFRINSFVVIDELCIVFHAPLIFPLFPSGIPHVFSTRAKHEILI